MDDEGIKLLQEAVRLLRVIARPQMRELDERFSASMLTSSRRRGMWNAMDGTRTLAEIAKIAGVTSEAVRLFVRDIEHAYPDLIEIDASGGAQRPRRRVI